MPFSPDIFGRSRRLRLSMSRFRRTRFIGRTTIVPNAADLADSGFPLAGGRIDIVDREPVPTLVYHSDRHVISITIVPKTSDAPPGEDHHDGSTLEHWNVGDLTYWAVSDLNAKDLRKLVGLLRVPG